MAVAVPITVEMVLADRATMTLCSTTSKMRSGDSVKAASKVLCELAPPNMVRYQSKVNSVQTAMLIELALNE